LTDLKQSEMKEGIKEWIWERKESTKQKSMIFTWIDYHINEC
jgi:hypothetical protein